MDLGNVTTLAIMLLGVLGLAVVLIAFRLLPRVTVVIWAAVLFFVPVWIGVQIGFFWAALTLVTIAAIISNLTQLRFAVPDLFVAAFAVLGAGLYVLGGVGLSALVIALLEWVIPYVWGRVILGRVQARFLYRVVAAFATIAAVLAVIEFATGRNVFIELPPLGPSFETWGTIQMRGGLLRAEGAFGHSIALGASLAIATAFVLAARWRTGPTLLALVVISAAMVMTFSRIALVTAVITIGLSVVLQRSLRRGTRVVVIVVSVLAAVVAVPFLSSVFLEAGTEAAGSADYRTDLLGLLPELHPFGAIDDWSAITADGTYLGAFAGSVDNALLVVALRFGAVPALIVVGLVVAAAISVLVPGRANPASIAVVGQIPALFSVAFITQYGSLLWFAGGLAVSLALARKAASTDASPLAPALVTDRARGTAIRPAQPVP